MRAALWMPPLQPFPSSPRHTEKLCFSFQEYQCPTRKLGSLERQSFLNHLVLPVGPSMSKMDISTKAQQYLYHQIQ